eukprot:TRINITY_DN16093_c0_g1_i5.p2 TRINITY_DN16093_c0_g1~~TRINITY_DN16093_c0_g1_i5.p2  ORF type:complete len:111 (+),score=11.05 TRINITY_DN16093_c0_g1_i5:194-526(+)
MRLINGIAQQSLNTQSTLYAQQHPSCVHASASALPNAEALCFGSSICPWINSELNTMSTGVGVKGTPSMLDRQRWRSQCESDSTRGSSLDTPFLGAHRIRNSMQKAVKRT